MKIVPVYGGSKYRLALARIRSWLWMPALLLCIVTPVRADCTTNRLEVQVLGSGGPELDDERASAGYLVRLDGRGRLLVDFGAGAAYNFERAGGRIEDLDAVLFTHLHVDHSADLPALVKASYFSPRTRDLPVYGPGGNQLMPALDAWLAALFAGPDGAWHYLAEYLRADAVSDYKLHAHTIDLPDEGRFSGTIGPFRIDAVPVVHGPIPALAWRVEVEGCVIAFSGDTSNRTRTLETIAAGSDLFVAHNAVPEDAGPVALNLHMPPSEIGRVAAAAKVKSLLLSHRMRRTLGREAETLALIRGSYAGPVEFAEDLASYRPAGNNAPRKAATTGRDGN